MKIPKKLKVGGHIITVKEYPFDEERSCCGDTSYVRATIRINSSLTQSQKEASFIHELFHVLNTTMDHALIDSLAEQLYQVLSDNKLLKRD
jgi:hypothetical protein